MTHNAAWLRWRQRFAIACLLPAYTLVLLSPPTVSEGTLADLVTDSLGWLLFSAGLALRFWSTLYIGGRKGSTTIIDGPYSICRNPLYCGSFMVGSSFALFLKGVTLILAMVAVAAFYFMVIVVEERRLSRRLGEDYDEYCRRTPRLFPRTLRIHTPEFIDVNVKAMWKEFRWASASVVIAVGLQMISYFRAQPSWPHFFAVP